MLVLIFININEIYNNIDDDDDGDDDSDCCNNADDDNSTNKMLPLPAKRKTTNTATILVAVSTDVA